MSNTEIKTEKRPDRRVKKTKRAIRNALAILLSEKDIEEITIKDIADTADINRKTFYNYYSGVHQVVDEIENEIVCDFEKAMDGIDFDTAVSRPYVIFEPLNRIINSDVDFYSHLMKTKRNSTLVDKIIRSLMRTAKKSVADRIAVDNLTLDIMIEYTIVGMLGVYQQWFNSDRSCSIEEISKTLGKLCFEGVSGIIENTLPKRGV